MQVVFLHKKTQMTTWAAVEKMLSKLSAGDMFDYKVDVFTPACHASSCVSSSLPLCRLGGLSVGGVNSQVRMSEAAIEASFRDLRELISPFQVCLIVPIDLECVYLQHEEEQKHLKSADL